MSSPAENLFQEKTIESDLFSIDRALETKSAGTCDLLLYIERQAIHLSLKERRSGRLLAFEQVIPSEINRSDWKDILENVSSTSRILRGYEFSKVTACICSNEFTLVPEALFKTGDEVKYFRKNFSSSVKPVILSRHIQSHHLHTIFGIESELQSELNHLFQDPQIVHHSEPLLAGMSLLLNSVSGKHIWINIHSGMVDIIVAENKKLLLMNSFSYTTNEDLLYYVLNVFDQLNISPEVAELTVTGNITNNSALHQLLLKYIREVRIPEKPSGAAYSFPNLQLPFHRIAMIYNLALCE